MMNGENFSAQFAAKAEKVAAEAPSTSHWKGVRDLVAERLGVDRGEVYVSTISKPGNVTVRFFQSRVALNGKYLVAMYNGDPDELDAAISSLEGVAKEREGMAVIATREGSDWEIVAGTGAAADPMAKALVSEFPGAVFVGF